MELADASNVPIVICSDGGVLLRAVASKKLLGKRKKGQDRKKRQRKTVTTKKTPQTDSDSDDDGKGADSDGEEDEVEEEEVVQPKKKRTAQVESKDNTKTQVQAKRTPTALVPTETSNAVPSASTQPQLQCRYRNGDALSDVFPVSKLVRFAGSPTDVQKNTLVLMNGKWMPLPTGVEPEIPEEFDALCEVYRTSIGLF